MKTNVVSTDSIQRKWYVIDAADMVLGRLASTAATLLIGKGKPAYSPNQDHGDNVIVVNAEKVRLTGRKPETKAYFVASPRPGSSYHKPFSRQMEEDPTKVITHAVRGMTPKTKLGRAIIKKLHVYASNEHPHAAQKPIAYAADNDA